jgi:hypothetical protein
MSIRHANGNRALLAKWEGDVPHFSPKANPANPLMKRCS